MTPYEQLFENNRRWVASVQAEDPGYFERLAEGQQPAYLFIGCSDSRVSATQITGTTLGEMFVHRNIANLVLRADLNLLSVMAYAVAELRVRHILVCGHYGCGGVRAAIDGHRHGLVDEWLLAITDVYRRNQDELDGLELGEARHRRLVELNVVEQVFRASTVPFVHDALAAGQLQVHGLVYDMSTGLLHDLGIDVERDFPGRRIYRADGLA